MKDSKMASFKGTTTSGNIAVTRVWLSEINGEMVLYIVQRYFAKEPDDIDKVLRKIGDTYFIQRHFCIKFSTFLDINSCIKELFNDLLK